jgi:hypothetical protein
MALLDFMSFVGPLSVKWWIAAFSGLVYLVVFVWEQLGSDTGSPGLFDKLRPRAGRESHDGIVIDLA